MVDFPFGPWRPDLRRTNSQNAQNARGCIHSRDGYLPAASPSPEGSALPDRALIGVNVLTHGLVPETYAGTSTGLYFFDGVDWQDYSRAGGYLLPQEQVWSSAVWKDGQLIMSTRSDPIQSILTGSETQFSDLFQAGSTYKPQAKDIAVVGEFLLMVNIDEPTLGLHPDRFWWTALGDITDPDPSISTQAGFRDIPGDIGELQAVFGWDYAILFAENAIYRANYVRGDLIWDIQDVEKERGLYISTAAAQSGRRVYYLAADGFYVTDGLSSAPVGEDKVNEYFLNRLGDRSPWSVSAQADPTRRLIQFALTTAGSQPNEIAVLSEETGEWTWIDQDVDVLVQDRGRGTNLDLPPWDDRNLDGVDYGGINLDSAAYAGGNRIPSAILDDHRLARFTGLPYTAQLETGDLQPFAGQRTYAQGVRPVVEGSGSNMTLQIGRKETPQETLTWSPQYQLNNAGKFTFEEEARYLRMRLEVSNGFDRIWMLQSEDDQGDLQPAGVV